MMNQYRDKYNRTGGGTSRCGDAVPYRRSPMRNDMMPRGFTRPGGYGCGVGRPTPRSMPYEQNPPCDAPHGNIGGHGSRGNGRTEDGSCGCRRPTNGCDSGRVSVNCKKLMAQIRAVDFALYETVLYLDVYPHSCDALETYHKLRAQSEALRAEYEASCGPLTAFGNRGDTWDWMSGPFPWEYGAE